MRSLKRYFVRPTRLGLLSSEIALVLFLFFAMVLFSATAHADPLLTSGRGLLAAASSTDGSPTPGDLFAGGAGVAGALLGGSVVWLGDTRNATRRERFDEWDARRKKIADFEEAIFDFAQAFAEELDKVTDIGRINSRAHTQALAGRVLALARRIESKAIDTASQTLVTLPDEIRKQTSLIAQAQMLKTQYKAALDEILDETGRLYIQDEKGDRAA